MNTSDGIGLLPVQNAGDLEPFEDEDFLPGTPREADVDRKMPKASVRSNSQSTAWDDEFREKEAKIRDLNHAESAKAKGGSGSKSSSVVVPFEHDRMFLSHSWRNSALQSNKKDLFSRLTAKGCVFWADFLDLHNEGAVAWRKEVEDAISGCSKLVAFVDVEYLVSFNCLEELAFAMKNDKPVVLAILDQAAWDLLTSIGGAKQAWSMQPLTGMPLSSYEGQATGPDKTPFTLEMVEDIFRSLSSINFCPCRELDFTNEGMDQVADRLHRFIDKDLDYTKEYASLKRRAEGWRLAGKPAKLLLPEKESKEWNLWIDMAVRTGNPLQPTEAQKEFVAASLRRAKQQIKIKLSAVALAVFLILAGAAAAVAFAIHAEHQRSVATTQRQVAEDSRALAEKERKAADELRLLAEEHSRVAEEQRQLAEEQKAFAEAQRQEAVRQGAVASTLLLSADRSPYTTAGVRALLRAADEADKFGIPGVILPALHDTLKHLMYAPFQFLDLEGHNSRIHVAKVSPSGTKVVSCSSDGSIRVWPITWPAGSGVPELVTSYAMPQEEDCERAVWLSDTKFAAGFKDGSLHIWEEQAGGSWSTSHNVEAHTKKITSLAVSRDHSLVATGSKDKHVGIWTFDSTSGEPVSEWMNKAGANIKALEISPDGKTLVMEVKTGGLTLVDLSTNYGESVVSMPDGTDGTTEALSFSPNGEWLAVGLTDGNVYLLQWNSSDPASSEFKHILSSVSPTFTSLKEVKGITWSSETTVIVAADDGTATIWDIRDTASPQDVILYKTSASGASVPLTGVDFSEVLGGGVIAVSSEDSMLRLYFSTPDLGTRGPEKFLMRNSMGETIDISTVAWSKTGDRVAACTKGGDIGIWKRRGDSPLEWEEALFAKAHGITDGKTACMTLDWSHDGSMVAAGTDAETIEVWQEANGEWKHFMTGPVNGNVRRDPSFSLDGRFLAVAGKGGPDIRVFRIPDVPETDPMEPELVIQGNEEGEVKALAFAPLFTKGSSGDPALVLASSEEDGLHLWELSEESPGNGLNIAGLVELNDMGNLYATQLKWSPQGMLCAMAPEGKGAVWHWKQGSSGNGNWTALLQIDGHTGILGKMDWSIDGTKLAVPFEDSSVRFYSIDEDLTQASGLWQIERRCDWLQWLHSGKDEADRVACASTLGAAAAVGQVYDFTMEMMMVDFEEQHQLLQQFTYGRLTSRDLKTLRLQDLDLDF